MIEFLSELKSVGLNALFNPTFLFLLVVLFFMGRLVGWMTKGLNIWKFIALAYFGIFLFRPLQDAGIIIGGVFILGVASMYMDLFRGIFGWAGSFSDIFFAFRSPGVYRDINRLEREIEQLRQQLNASQMSDGSSGQSSTQQQWRQQAQARSKSAKSGSGASDGGSTSSQGRSSQSSKARTSSRSASSGTSSGFAGQKRKTGSGAKSSAKANANPSAKSQKAFSKKPSSGASQRTKPSGSQQRNKSASSGSYQKTQSSGSQKKSSSSRSQQSSSQSSGSQQQSSSSQNQKSQSKSSGTQQQQATSSTMAPSLRDRYLTILELAPGQTYTDQDIKAAWRKMAFKTHPDRGGSAAAFNEAFSAYKALK